MADAAALFQLVVYALTALLYSYVGLVILKRKTSPDSKTANTLFALFWLGLGATWAIILLFYVTFLMGGYVDWVGLVGLEAMIVTLCLAVWGLLYYLVFLYTGDRRWLVPLTAAYALLMASFVALVAWRDPIGLTARPLGFEITYARSPATWITVASSLLFSGPIVAAALAYGSLYWRVTERGQRLRIALVAGSFFTWFGWSVLQALLGLPELFADSVGFALLNQSIGILVPLVVLAAYRPPAWLRTRMGLALPDAHTP